MSKKNSLIVALDVSTEKEVRSLCSQLADHVSMFKIGLELFLSLGPKSIALVKEYGAGVFLDLKLHDIPNTVEKSIYKLLQNDVDLINVHSLGGLEMMKAAVRGREKAESADSADDSKAKVIGVTILTSHSLDELKKLGISSDMDSAVVELSKLVLSAGLDGVVAPARYAISIKENCGDNFLVVSPGIRLKDEEADDQKLISTPKEALENGVDYIVIGRPITESPNPAHTAQKILKDSMI